MSKAVGALEPLGLQGGPVAAVQGRGHCGVALGQLGAALGPGAKALALERHVMGWGAVLGQDSCITHVHVHAFTWC